MNKTRLMGLMLGLGLIIAVICLIILNYNKEKCDNDGGRVITDGMGLFDRCIYNN